MIYQPNGQVLKWNGKEYVDSGIRYPAYDISPDIEAIKAIEQAERQKSL